jgi:hypothetical protein
MNMEYFRSTMDRMGIIPILILLAGCGSNGGAVRTPAGDYSAIRKIEWYYDEYVGTHSSQPPKDEQVFREYLNSKQDGLTRDGLTVDQIFVSPRNGEPLVWLYGKTLVTGPMGMNYIAYEKSSTDGKRLALAAGGRYEVLDEAKFHSLFPDAK